MKKFFAILVCFGFVFASGSTTIGCAKKAEPPRKVDVKKDEPKKDPASPVPSPSDDHGRSEAA